MIVLIIICIIALSYEHWYIDKKLDRIIELLEKGKI